MNLNWACVPTWNGLRIQFLAVERLEGDLCAQVEYVIYIVLYYMGDRQVKMADKQVMSMAMLWLLYAVRSLMKDFASCWILITHLKN